MLDRYEQGRRQSRTTPLISACNINTLSLYCTYNIPRRHDLLYIFVQKPAKRLLACKEIYSIDFNFKVHSRGNAVGAATVYGMDDRGVGIRIPEGSGILTPPYFPDRPRGPLSFLSNGYRDLSPRE
jgi:hypothetical protein